ncbi:MAG: hypothetical protein KA954_12355, partial [Chitinophagales bacterium]|nr:hypothetical protein [Chitinophagales bacterium]
MKKFYLIALTIQFCFLQMHSEAQVQKEIKNGYIHPADGVFRVFIVFAELDYSTSGCSYSLGEVDESWPIVGGVTQIPTYADNLFDQYYTTGITPTNLISKFYYEASFGKYVILGDYYEDVITIPCSSYSGLDGVAEVIEALSNSISSGSVYSANGLPLSDFDNYDLLGGESNLRGVSKSNTSDDKIDLLVIAWRNNNVGSIKKCNSGFGVSYSDYSYTVDDKIEGVNTRTSFNVCGDEEGFFYIFQAEIMHGLFGPNNWHSAGGADKRTFLITPASAGITSQSPGTSASPSGWDRWMLEWEHPAKDQIDDVFISTGEGVLETDGDISIENLPNGGTFVLRDNYLTGDAVRIKLPHIDWQISGDIKNQFLWLENHQRLSEFDQEKYIDDCKTQGTGLYVSLQAGKDNNLLDDDASVYPATTSPSMPNSLGSWMMPISAEGNFDFVISTETPPYGLCEWDNGSLVIDMDNNIPNQFTGFSDLFKVVNGGDGVIGVNPSESDDLVIGRFKRFGSSVEHELYDFGDDLDAFTLSGNNRLSIATNPSPVSVYTYISNLYDPLYPALKNSWENDTIWLNGLNIEISAETTNTTIGGKDITVDISWDNYSVDNDVRWCGNIVLQNDVNDPLSRQSQIILEEGKVIKLERGKSPTQHIAEEMIDDEWIFTKPTTLTLKTGTKTTLKKNSCLLVNENSTLLIKSGAEIIIEEGAQLHAENGGQIIIEAGAIVKLSQINAKILVENGGELIIKPGINDLELTAQTKIEIENGGFMILEGNDIYLNSTSATITLKAGGTIQTANYVDFTFTGTGYLAYYEDGIFDLGTDSRFYLKGSGTTDMKCWLQTDADLYISTRDVWLEDCKIVYNNNSLMRNAYANFYAENVLFNTGGSTAINGISAYDTESFYITQGTFDGFATPVKLENISVCPEDVNVEIRQTTIKNYTQNGIQAEDVHRMYLYANSIEGNANATTGLWLENVIECRVEAGNIKNHTYQPGVFLYNTRYFILDGATIKSNYRGIESYRSNIYLRNQATIKLNTTEGIFALSAISDLVDPDILCKIVVGDIGCGWIIQNETGILGEDILLDIDAITHAINEGDTAQPNRFDGNTRAIEVCYEYFNNTYISDTLMARGNYWTGGGAPIG